MTTATSVPRRQDLSEGALGMALLDIEHGDLATARRHVERAVEHGVSTGANASLFHGAPALEFVLTQAGTARSAVREAVDWVVDNRLAAVHRRQIAGGLPHLAEWDLIRGATGLAALLLTRPVPCQRLRHLLQYLVALTRPVHADGHTVPGWWSPVGPGEEEMPGGHGNNGIAHGIAGPLSVLSLAARRDVRVPGQDEAINALSLWLSRYGGDYWTTYQDLTSTKPTDRAPARPSWCYGRPGIARAQQLAALALNNPQQRHAAEGTVLQALTDPAYLARITDSTLCHGWAGLLTLTRAVAADSPESERFTPLITDLRQRLLRDADGLTRPGLMEGRVGAQLALADTGTTAWARALLIT